METEMSLRNRMKIATVLAFGILSATGLVIAESNAAVGKMSDEPAKWPSFSIPPEPVHS